jgi:GTP cyclohydrolase I
MSEPPPPSDTTAPEPISVTIRGRLQRARKRFNANDNIAAFVEPGEMDALLAESPNVGVALRKSYAEPPR